MPESRPVGHSETSVRAAVERVVEDLRKRSVWLADDTVPTVMSWYDAHRLHKTEPYIGCPFCHGKFMPVAEHKAKLRAIAHVAETTGGASDMTDENDIARLRDVARQLERERDEARCMVRDLVAVMDAFNFDRAMREHHIAARHVREWGFDPPLHDTTSIHD